MNIGEYIKRTRIDKGMTLRQVAKYAGIDPSYLSRVETGKRPAPSGKKLRDLARVLGVDASELMAAAGYIDRETNIGLVANQIVARYPEFKDILLRMSTLPPETVYRIIGRIEGMLDSDGNDGEKKKRLPGAA